MENVSFNHINPKKTKHFSLYKTQNCSWGVTCDQCPNARNSFFHLSFKLYPPTIHRLEINSTWTNNG